MSTNTDSFLGRYRLVKVLGQGAMGVVYEAVDTRLNRTVAIKTVLRSHMADETTATEYATRFEREAQAAARLSHPHVVTVYDFGEHEDISYIVMEFIRGRELNQAFEAGQSFPLPEVVRIMRELLSALDYAHQQGIVHRDIKPANVMLDGAGHVKLTDFGVARVANANQDRTMPGTLVGTPSYMSPEQILGLAVGSRADIFAAGVILYQFLTGKRPFSGGGPFGVQRKIVQDDPEPPSKANPSLPPGFDEIVSRALAKQPENRYENAGAFAADLERIGATLPRDVPLIDLDLDVDPTPTAGSFATSSRPPTLPPAWPPSQPPAPPPPSRPPAPPAACSSPDLTLITVVPFGTPPPPAAPAANPLPHDPEATILMTSAKRSDAGSDKGTWGGSTASRPLAATMPATTPMARMPAAPAAPKSAATATATPSAAASPTGPGLAPLPRRAQAVAPAPMRPMPRADARDPDLKSAPRRNAWLPLSIGVGVGLVLIAAWALVARPWSRPVAVTSTAASPPAVEPQVVPAAPKASSPLPAAARPAAAVTGEPAAAPAATTLPAPAAATPAAQTRPEAPAKASPARPTADPAATRPAPARTEAPRPQGIEPRCSDLLQRMQLGEPLTADQTAYFQTRCTR